MKEARFWKEKPGHLDAEHKTMGTDFSSAHLGGGGRKSMPITLMENSRTTGSTEIQRKREKSAEGRNGKPKDARFLGTRTKKWSKKWGCWWTTP